MPNLEKHSQKDLTDQSKAISSRSRNPELLQQLRRAHSFPPYDRKLIERQAIAKVQETYEAEQHSNDSPQKSPALTDLPKEQWWKVYIDAPFHEQAMKKSDPGKLFDDQRSPGYQQSIIEALDTFVVQKDLQQKDLDYDLYTQIHQCATKYIWHKEFGSYQREWMSKPNGVSSESPYPFTFARLDPIPEEGPKRQERLVALKEMHTEHIHGVPLYTDHPDYDVEKQKWLTEMSKDNTYDFLEYICDHGFMHLKNNAPNMQEMMDKLHIHDKPQGIIMGVTSTHDRSVAMLPLYSPDQGPAIVSACFSEYNDRKKIPNQSEDQILKSIAKLVRQVHMVHQKYDGMGRTNTCVLLNKELIAHSFSPTILPHGPGVFGGLKTLDGLVKDIRDGMHKFQETVENSKFLAQEGFLPDVDKQQDSSTKAMYEEIDKQIKEAKETEGEEKFEKSTLKCFETDNKYQWLEGTFNKVAIIYHGMNIIKKRQQNEKFKELFMANSEKFFEDSPPHEKFQIPMQDSLGKLFMQNHGLEFLKLDLGKIWLQSENGIRWHKSYSGKILYERHKEDLIKFGLEKE